MKNAEEMIAMALEDTDGRMEAEELEEYKQWLESIFSTDGPLSKYLAKDSLEMIKEELMKD
jgi:hypothetical protein